jgi:uncharacterized OB-fold protein
MNTPLTPEREKLMRKLGLTEADFVKPLPKPFPWSQPFWEAAREGRLLSKTCLDCGHVDHPPYLYCTACGSDRHEWRTASGTATLVSYAVNTYGVPAAFMEDLPYVLAIVKLPEGPQMISNIVDCDPARLRNGMPLEVVFHETAPGVVLPKWRPAQGA